MTTDDPTTDSPQEDTFVTLLLEHRHRLFAFLAKQLVNPADVEDVFQKTSLVLWKKMSEYDPTKSFFHWACGIAFNEARNHRRSQSRARLQFESALAELIAEEAKDEADLSEARLRALRQCVATLPNRQQQILQHCYAGTETITQIAEGLGRERGALYKQLARLREKLLVCIQQRLAREGLA